MFLARVPLSPSARAKITVSDPWSYAQLGEAVEAWGFRYIQHEHRFCDRAEIAKRWFSRGVHARRALAARRRVCSAPGPRPRLTCAWRVTATA